MAINAFQLRQLGVMTPPLLHISSTNGSIQISWTGLGSLQQAPKVIGPWMTTTNGGVSPYMVVPSGGQQFYRLKVQ